MKASRMAGLLLPLFTIKGTQDDGIGDLKALEEWIDWAKEAKVKFLQLLPINALGMGDAPSPYSAISSVALEPLYLSMDRVPGLPACSAEAAAQESERRRQLPPRQLPAGEHLVDYLRVREEKENKLRRAWHNFKSDDSYATLRQEYQQWVEQEGKWLDDYSIYRVASSYFNSINWTKWPEQHPDAIRYLVNSQEQNLELKHYHQWLQWLCAKEWKQVRAYADAAGVMLMGDVPIGISIASADVFFERELFDMQWSGGAPAEGNFAEDPFTGKWGQNWGIPLYKWDAMERDNYSWWARRILKMAEIFSMYRIDHILGFYRIYAFPWMPNRNPEFLALNGDEAAARCEGRRPGFRPYDDWTKENRMKNLMQGDKLLSAMMRISQGMHVIGEDLGCVPDYVRPNLSQLRIAGFKIPHWEIDEHHNITRGQTYNRCSFATYATHDFPPISEDWNTWYQLVVQAQETLNGTNDADNQALSTKERNAIQQSGKNCLQVLKCLADYSGLENPQQAWGQEVKDKLFTALMNCNSDYVALMWTELFDENIRLNTPGTQGGQNWRARMHFTASEAKDKSQSAWLRQLIQQSKRG